MILNQQELQGLLQKVASFTRIAVSAVDDLKSEVSEYKDKVAAYRMREIASEEREKQLLAKTAALLYETDFIQDDSEKRKFLKQAESDPVGCLARALEKVCKAADVALIGSPARVAAKPKIAEYDPVAARAFGWDTRRGLLD